MCKSEYIDVVVSAVVFPSLIGQPNFLMFIVKMKILHEVYGCTCSNTLFTMFSIVKYSNVRR